jgi:hypothetical protein
MEADASADACPDAEKLRLLLASLPHALFLRVLAALPADARARAATVCRAWRDALRGREAWTRLDLSMSSGVPERTRTGNFLREAAARALGGLTHLDLTGLTFNEGNICEVLAANAATLRTLRILNEERLYTARSVRLLLAAAHSLAVLHANVSCHPPEALGLLRCEAPYEKLRMQQLCLIGTAAAGRTPETLAVFSQLSSHAWLTGLQLAGYTLQRDIMDAAADAALQARLRKFALHACHLSPDACVAPLARLLAGGALRELVISDATHRGRGGRLLDAPGAATLGDALRVCASITRLQLSDVSFWLPPFVAAAAPPGDAGDVGSGDDGAGAALLAALHGHATLRVLTLDNNDARRCEATAGVALGALVAANAPALIEVSVCNNGLGDAGLAPLMEALQHNAHLRVLDVSCTQAESAQFARMTAPFARQVLMPAVLNSGSLRELRGIYYTIGANEAVSQLRRRARAAAR